MSDEHFVDVDIDGPVARVTLRRPASLNAQTPQMWKRLRDIGRSLPGDVRCVVVSGEGPAFSAGIDLKVLTASLPRELASATDDDAHARLTGFQEAFTWLRRPDITTIAAVQGHAIGAGLQLALACDIKILTTDAILRVGEPRLGLVPDLGGTKLLVDAVGYSRAVEISLTGRDIPADEAAHIGLATVVVPTTDLADTVDDVIAALLEVPREAAIETKALLQAASHNNTETQLTAERDAQLRLIRDMASRAI